MSAKPVPRGPGAAADAARIAAMLRVDHAGEVAARGIYRGHKAVFAAAGKAAEAAQMQAFEDEEGRHLARFDTLLLERGVRPTMMAPIWRAAAYGLGVGAALIGESAVHACTEAVETVIAEHYAGQIAELETRDPALAAELSAFRDDELAHRDQAVAAGARSAPLHGLLTALVAGGCRAAIKISERV
jgi:ubiquinone biosynthesis monooxygenase Coq7